MADKEQVAYEPRERLDSELNSAIGDILAAEDEARHIVAQAEESVKAIQLDGATRERDMRSGVTRYAASAKDKAINSARERATAECERMRAEAEKAGETLVSSKKKDIEALAEQYFNALVHGGGAEAKKPAGKKTKAKTGGGK